MTERISPRQFHETDWRIVRDDASTHFRTGSFSAGVALVEAIGRLADAPNHHPDVDLRSDGVTVRLGTHGVGYLFLHWDEPLPRAGSLRRRAPA